MELPPGPKEPGGFVLALIYTQRFVGSLALDWRVPL